jgi:hypothetical protein
MLLPMLGLMKSAQSTVIVDEASSSNAAGPIGDRSCRHCGRLRNIEERRRTRCGRWGICLYRGSRCAFGRDENVGVRNKHCRLGKQPHRLPNIRLNAITDVGLDEASPAADFYLRVNPVPSRQILLRQFRLARARSCMMVITPRCQWWH